MLAVRILGLLVVALAAAVAVAGCGGEDESAAGAEPLTRAEFVQKASALCKRERAGLSKEAAKTIARERARGKPHDVALAETAHRVLLPAIENEIEVVWRLAMPPADRPGIRAAFSAEELIIDRLANADRITSMDEFHRLFANSALQLRFNDLDACAND